MSSIYPQMEHYRVNLESESQGSTLNFPKGRTFRFLVSAIFFVLAVFGAAPNTALSATVATSPPLSPNAQGLTKGLVGYWTFDGKDMVNGVARDVSGNYATGTPTNISTSTFYTAGKIGQGFNFDGVNDYVSGGSAFNFTSQDFSFSLWVKVKLTTDFAAQGPVPIYKGGFQIDGYYLQIGNNGRVSFVTNQSGANQTTNTVTNMILDNQWGHIVITRTGASVKIFVNGVVRNNSSATHIDPATSADAFQMGFYGNTIHTKGIIDDFRVYSRALSAQEVKQLYNLGTEKFDVSPPLASTGQGLTKGLVGYWTFDGKDVVNGVVLDKSGNGNNGNLVNIATSTFYKPGKIGQALNFDGKNDYVQASSTSLDVSQITTSAWIKTTTAGKYIIAKDPPDLASPEANQATPPLQQGSTSLKDLFNNLAKNFSATLQPSTYTRPPSSASPIFPPLTSSSQSSPSSSQTPEDWVLYKRDREADVYRSTLDPNKFQARISSAPVNYWDGEEFKPIDLNIKTLTDSPYLYAMDSAPYQIYFPKTLQDPIKLNITNRTDAYSFKLENMSYDLDREIIALPNENSSPVVSERLVTYPNAFTVRDQKIDIEYTLRTWGMKEFFVLKQAPPQPASELQQGSTLLKDIAKIVKNLVVQPQPFIETSGKKTLDFAETINYNGLIMYLKDKAITNQELEQGFTTSGSLEFHDPKTNKTVFRLPAPYAIDARDQMIATEYFIKSINGQTFVYNRTPYEWLSDSSRAYPIRIDASPETITAGFDVSDLDGTSFQSSSATTLSLGANGVGSENRAGIDFNTSVISDSATITQVDFKFYVDTADATAILTADEMTGGGSPTGKGAAKVYFDASDKSSFFNDANGIPSPGYLSGNTAPQSTGSKQVTLLSQAKTDLQNQLANDWFTIGLAESTQLNSEFAIRSMDYTPAGSEPTIIVTYTETCNSVSLNSGSYAANVGSTVDVSVTSSGTCSGIQIQDNTSGSYAIVPASDTDLDCNGGTCSGNTSFSKTLKCEASGTYSIRPFHTDVTGSVSTVSCTVPKTSAPYGLNITSAGKAEMMYINSGAYYAATSTTSVNDGKWHHVVGTYDGSNVKVYVDGNLEDTHAGSGNLPVIQGPLRIGADYNSTPGNFFNGSIDDVRMYNRALSAQEVKQLYNLGAEKFAVSPPLASTGQGLTKGLVGYWTFDGKDMVNGAVRDVSGNYATGTPTNISTSTFYAPGKIGQGFNFDGVNDYVDGGDIGVIDTATQLSACVWAFPTRTIGQTVTIMSKDNAGLDGFFFRRETPAFVSNRANAYEIVVLDSTSVNNSRVEGAAESAPLNKWTHVCFTFKASSSTGLRLYINGVQDPNSPVSTASIASIDAGANNLRIGTRASSLQFFPGKLDDVRVYNRALSAQEIKQLYNMGR